MYTGGIYIFTISSKNYGIADVNIEGYYYGEAEEETTYTVSTSITPENAGSITQTPGGTTLLAETAVSFTANPSTGYKFVKWVDGDDKEVSAAKTYNIESLSADVTLKAVFEALPYIKYEKAGEESGVVPSQVWNEAGAKITLPENTSLYLSGYNFAGWSDGTTTYKAGEQIELPTEGGITLKPMFEVATSTLAELIAAARLEGKNVVFNWNFATKTGAPSMSYQGIAAEYVLRFSGNDVAMHIETTKSAVIAGKTGKVDNTASDVRTQVNNGTKLTIPVISGAVVEINVAAGTLTASTIKGNKISSSYTATEDGDIDIIIADDNIYLSSITVTYAPTAYPVVISDLEAATFSASVATIVPDGVIAYTGELSSDNSTLSLNKVDGVIPAEEPVVLLGDKGDYSFAVSSEAGTTPEKNSLKANLTKGKLTAETGYVNCVLNSVGGSLGFYKLNTDSELGANKAYLPVPTTSTSAPSIRIVFGDEPGNVTAIESIAAERDINAPIFNLAGQKVNGRVAPGLYIQGGKKILVK